jgi:DNA-binding LacI/PurR family transcriptional regulator
LTTVAINTPAIAELSVDMLIRLIAEPAQPPSMIIAPPPVLVVRASTREPLVKRASGRKRI